MKNTTKIFSWIALLVFTCITNSCKVMESANRHYEYLEYTKAIPQYNKALKNDSTNAEAWAKLGDCYRLNNQTVEAESAYAKAVASSAIKNVYKLYYAEMLVNNGKYPEAHEWVEDYMKSEPGDPRGAVLDSGISHMKDFFMEQDEFRVEKININTSEAEYGPAVYKDGIIFASSRESEKWANRSHSWTGKRYYSLYYAKGKETNFDAPVVFLKGIQTKYNNSSVCFNKNGIEMILTRNNVENGKVKTSDDMMVKLKLYTSTLKDGNWSDVVPFQYNSDQYSCAHPALSPDGNKLYFASDMPGSIGGMDLWVCSRTANGWSQPRNLGPSVNTKGNEIFPCVADDGIIYFSSNGREGMGGLDIYSTAERDGSYSKPVNAGAPINSSDDDFGLIWTTVNKNGYFTSNRTHQGYNDDIFFLTKNVIKLNGLVYDRMTNKPLGYSRVRIIEEDSMISMCNTDTSGDFNSSVRMNKNYSLIAEHTNYKTDTIHLTVADLKMYRDSVFIKIPLEKQEMMITLEGKIYNETTDRPVNLARMLLINLTRQDTLNAITGSDGEYAFANVDANCRYQVVAETEFCLPHSVDTSTIGVTENKVIRIDMALYCLSENFVLHNIYYDLDKYNIRPDAARELDKLVALMLKYPQVKIELGSHTDCRASYDYNMRLSQNRAKSAVAYLVAHGVNRSILTAQGYGESKLINHCECEGERKVECTEEEHQLNRRTEIRVLSWHWSIASIQ